MPLFLNVAAETGRFCYLVAREETAHGQARKAPSNGDRGSTTEEMLRAGLGSEAFDFWLRPDEDIYSESDGTPL